MRRETVSTLLLIQLYMARQQRSFDIYRITDIIHALEGLPSHSKAKLPKPFNQPPLKGLYKVHFVLPQFIGQNIFNHWKMSKANSGKFDLLLRKVLSDEEKTSSRHGWVGRLAHGFVVGGYWERAQKGKLTGEWLILGEHEGQRYYLSIVKHSSNRTDDEDIYRLLKLWCKPEFPFLF